MSQLNGASRVFPIIGDPIRYVESPVWLTSTLAARGHNGICVPMQVPDGGLDVVLAGLTATANVDERVNYYRVELQEWEHYPLTGVGPGNFVYRFFQYAPAAGVSLPFPSNVLTISGEEAYLVILAEQGAVGLALFLGYLVLSWADLRRRFPADRRADQLQMALAAGFVVACVGALFLAEQYYPPLWFLPAVGASLASLQREAGTPGPGLGVPGHPRGGRG